MSPREVTRWGKAGQWKGREPSAPAGEVPAWPEALTLEHVAAHHGQTAALHQVAHWHVPAHCPVDARVTGLHTFQGVDGHGGVPLDHSDGIIGGTDL